MNCSFALSGLVKPLKMPRSKDLSVMSSRPSFRLQMVNVPFTNNSLICILKVTSGSFHGMLTKDSALILIVWNKLGKTVGWKMGLSMRSKQRRFTKNQQSTNFWHRRGQWSRQFPLQLFPEHIIKISCKTRASRLKKKRQKKLIQKKKSKGTA